MYHSRGSVRQVENMIPFMSLPTLAHKVIYVAAWDVVPMATPQDTPFAHERAAKHTSPVRFL